MIKTRDGQRVDVIERNKPGMSIFTTFGTLNGRPCHWTADGRYRMDGVDDPRDLTHDNEEGAKDG